MRKTQKILSFILAILMVMSIIPITASAETEHGTCGDNLTWEFNYYTGALTISGTGVMYDYNWNNRPWEDYKDNVNKIVINDGVTSIGDYAFSGLYNLTDVTISDSVTIIDDCAFSECSELTSIIISSGVTAIGKNAFSWCYNLTSITVDSDNLYYSNDEHGVLFNKDKTTLVQYTTGKTETSYIIPDSVTTIDYYAFGYSDSLTSIAIPASVTTIGDDAFYCCTNLTSITVDADNPNYSSDDYGVLFNKDKTMLIQHPVANAKTNYTIPDSVTTIKRTAFIFCEGLTSVTIPDSVVIIGEYAFTWCYGLTDVKIPDSVTTIGDGAFGYCSNLTDMIIPDSVTTIGDYAFQNCTNLTNIKISKSIKKIGYHTFLLCESLTNITIPDNVTIIDENAFSACFSLTSIIIPDNVTTIGACAFDSCYNLKDVYYKGTEEQWKSISIDNYNEPLLNATIHYNYHMHKYNEVITDPTCTEQGYTTYTCKCGDSYVADYIDALGHTEETIPAVAPTCTETGLAEGTKCSLCGETLTEQEFVPETGHSPANAVEENYIAPACTENGIKDVVVYCSVCDEEISRDTVVINATGHADNDGDGYCDADNELLDPSVECECNCHKDGITNFFFKLILFFQRIFGLNKECACGAIHY